MKVWLVVTIFLCSNASMAHGSGCNIGTDTIRLVGGLSDQGLVEICDGNQWKSVCGFLWNDMKAEIVCRELNLTYFGAQAFSGRGCNAFDMSTSDEGILIQVCTGEERSITECHRSEQTNCIAAGVICSPPCHPSFCIHTGPQCSTPTSSCYCPTPSDTNCTCYEAVCSPACLNGGTCTAQGECQCPPGWTGHTCQQGICNPPCSNGGNCTGPDICQCPDTWEGETCQKAVCNPSCSNGGNCTGPDTCQCPDTWEGDYCLQAACEAGFCLNGGTCLYPDTNCTCPVGWTGSRCSQNTATTPSQSEMTLSVSENNDSETTGIVASSITVVCLVLLALAAIVTAFLVDRRRRRRRRIRFFKHSIRHADENAGEPPQIPAPELPQTPTVEQNLPAASSIRSLAIPIPIYATTSHSRRPLLTSSSTNIYTQSAQQDNSTQLESLYDDIVYQQPCNSRTCRVERLDTMHREDTEHLEDTKCLDTMQRKDRETVETVESALYRSTEELRAELASNEASNEFNIYDSPT